MIRKQGNKWAVISHTTGKVLARTDTKAEAEAELERRKRFRKK